MTTPLRPLPPGPRRGLKMPSPSTILIGLGGVVAVNLIIVAAFIGGRGDDNAPAIPTEIETLVPARNAQIRTQEDVGADLQDDYTGTLFIDDVRIPEDQLEKRNPDHVLFRPGEGKEVTRLAEGPHRATIVYRPQDPNRREPERSYTWQFTAG